MNPDAMRPHGLALLAYADGELNAELIMRRDDDLESHVPVSYFFRKPSEFSALERIALDHCSGRVLDVGAGSGVHTLVLQEQGFRVSAIDIDPNAVKVMTRRGVREARCTDVALYEVTDFDTVLLMGHGVGMAETLIDLDPRLASLRRFIAANGQVLLDSLDVRATSDPRHLAYQANNRLEGRYIGETRLQFEFRGSTGPYCGWLHVDAETLTEHADRLGWKCSILDQLESGDYLARLIPE
jgi:SAM-dependent methyltransferase